MPNTKAELLDLIKNAPGIIVGQHIGATDYPTRWNTYITALHTLTGKWPGLVGADFAYVDWPLSWQQLLIDHWNNGGLVTVCAHFYNPWTGNTSSDLTVGNIADLWTPGNVNYTAWHKTLDTIAARLMVLRNAGVVVLWRPLYECNGNWSWWDNLAPGDYISLWHDLRVYYDSKGLDNLLWVFSPNRWFSGIKRPEIYYPGDDCDIVGLDHYGSNFDDVPAGGYTALAALGKPFVLGEFGPHDGNSATPFTFDYSKLLGMMAEKCPQAKAFMAWDQGWSIVNQNGAIALMTDSRAITRDKVGITPTPPPPPPTTPVPTASIITSNATPRRSQSFTLTWKCTNAVRAIIDQGVGAVMPTGGSKTFSKSRRGAYKFTITATARDGRTAQASVTVMVR